jgi:hypothetical protein
MKPGPKRRPRLLATALPGLEPVVARAAAVQLGAQCSLSGPGWVVLDLPSLRPDPRRLRAAMAVYAWVRQVEGDFSASRFLGELKRRLHRTSFGEALEVRRQITGLGPPGSFRVVCPPDRPGAPFFELQRVASEALTGGDLGLAGDQRADVTVLVAAGEHGATMGLELSVTDYLVARPRPRRSVPPSFWAAAAAEAGPGRKPVLLVDADDDLAAEVREFAPEAPLVVCQERGRAVRELRAWASGAAGTAVLRATPERLPVRPGGVGCAIWVAGSGRAERVWPELGRAMGGAASEMSRLVVAGPDSPLFSHRLARAAGFEVERRRTVHIRHEELHLLTLRRAGA